MGACTPDPVTFVTVSTADEVRQILALQAENLSSVLPPETMEAEGFVTVRHDPAVLLRMNEAAPAVVAKVGERVVAYALVMPRAFASDVPVLRPLFEVLDELSWKGTPLRTHPRWFVMGQICIAAGYRGRGIFDGLYAEMRTRYGEHFDFTVTEIAARNTRSCRAHERVGFETLHVYTDATTGEWPVVALALAPSLR